MDTLNLHSHPFAMDRAFRAGMKRQSPFVLWMTGLSGSGKSTLSNLTDSRLSGMGFHCFTLDGDSMRKGLCRDLDFSLASRAENTRRTAEVARLMLDAGLIAIVSLISPMESERAHARSLFDAGEFIEVHVDVPLAVAESRDPKKLYQKARMGIIKDFTGIDSPYEAPLCPEIRVDTAALTPESACDRIFAYLQKAGKLEKTSLK